MVIIKGFLHTANTTNPAITNNNVFKYSCKHTFKIDILYDILPIQLIF